MINNILIIDGVDSKDLNTLGDAFADFYNKCDMVFIINNNEAEQIKYKSGDQNTSAVYLYRCNKV